MAIGIRMRQGSGVKVIDDRYSNLALITKGSYTTDRWDNDVVGQSGSANRRYVRVTGRTNPVMAIRATNTSYQGGGVRTRRIDRGGGVFDFYFVAPTDYSQVVAITTLEWWIFDVNPPAQTGRGVVIRNRTTGQVVFDSRQAYMKVVGFEQRTATFPYMQDRVWNYAYNKSNLAVIQSQTPMKQYESGSGAGGSTEVYTMRTRVSGNSVTVVESMEWIIFLNGGVIMQNTYTFAMLVIDVTGL